VKDRREFIEAIAEDESTTHEQWLDVVHICQVYGYHDCAMDILMSVTELFADRHTGAGDISSRSTLSLSLHIDERRYRPLSPPTDPPTATPTDDLQSQHDTHRPPVKPASLPSLQLSDNGRRNNKKRNKRWANSRTTTASDADAEFSDATTTDFTQ